MKTNRSIKYKTLKSKTEICLICEKEYQIGMDSPICPHTPYYCEIESDK